jgi:hypothetical protein
MVIVPLTSACSTCQREKVIYPTAYSFVMISPNLHAIWPFFFLNLPQDLNVVLLRYFGTLGEG